VRDLYLEALELTLARKYPEALPLLRRATELEPQNSWAWMMLGFCHDGLNDYAAAEGAYNVCVSLEPDSHGGYFNRGIAHLRGRHPREAAKDFDRALALNPDNVKALHNRALARQALRDNRDALDDLDRALALDPAASHLYFLRAQVHGQFGDRKAMAEDLRQGMSRTPRDVAGWNELGNAYLARRGGPFSGFCDSLRALAAFDAGLALDPDDRATLISKASVLAERLGRQRAAAAVLDHMIELYPNDYEAYSSRGVVRARLGDRAGAHSDATAALDRSREPVHRLPDRRHLRPDLAPGARRRRRRPVPPARRRQARLRRQPPGRRPRPDPLAPPPQIPAPARRGPEAAAAGPLNPEVIAT
jgi:tetratricopeptide (TPR) repeat protein